MSTPRQQPFDSTKAQRDFQSNFSRRLERGNIEQLRRLLYEKRDRLEAKRREVRDADRLIKQLQGETDILRQECFELQEIILEGLARLVAMKVQEQAGFPSFICMEGVEV